MKLQSNSSFLSRSAKIAGLDLAYLLAAKLTFLLATPPEYAPAVWPAAGIALAGILLFGRWGWPGILIGSFLVTIWTPLDATHPAAVLNSLPLPAFELECCGYRYCARGLF